MSSAPNMVEQIINVSTKSPEGGDSSLLLNLECKVRHPVGSLSAESAIAAPRTRDRNTIVPLAEATSNINTSEQLNKENVNVCGKRRRSCQFPDCDEKELPQAAAPWSDPVQKNKRRRYFRDVSTVDIVNRFFAKNQHLI